MKELDKRLDELNKRAEAEKQEPEKKVKESYQKTLE